MSLTNAPSRRRNAVAFCVDALLLVAILLLLSPRLTGLSLHEWLGIALGFPLFVHLLLSWQWISTSTARVLARANKRARINYVLNFTLFVLVVIELTSGIAISAVALPSIGVRTIDDRSWRALHNLTLNWFLLVLGFHVAMNWRPIVIGVRRYLWPRSGTHE